MSTEPEAPSASGPLLDIRVRWRAGRAALATAGLLSAIALLRPLGREELGGGLGALLAGSLALGLLTSGLLASLKGRGRAEQWALYAFLILAADAVGQVLAPWRWPAWPLLALLVGALAVAETLGTALGAAGLASILTLADAGLRSGDWRGAAAASLGYLALAVAVNRALLGEKRRLAAARAELRRLRQGIDHLEDVDPGSENLRPSTASLSLRQISEEGRLARQVERSEELDETLAEITRIARAAVGAHAVLYFGVDRKRDAAFLRAWDGPEGVRGDATIPLAHDPIAFVLDRNESFYATDYPRLLWALPYYQEELKIGTLLALPVRTAEVVTGVLVADRLEIQSFTGAEPGLLDAFAAMASRALTRARESQSREEMATEVKAVYAVSRNLSNLADPSPVRRLLVRCARDMVPSLEAAGVVTTDDAQTRYVVEGEAYGWVREFEGREVGLTERTWAGWVLRSAEEPYLLDDIAGQRDRMPVLVLDEGAGRADSLLAVPLRARNRTLGALLMTGRRGTFDATAHRVFGILANQAAAALANIDLVERNKRRALRDGLTDLYNRGAFDQALVRTVAQAARDGGRLAVLLLDLDHFKKLNDTYGHLAGDAALRNTARLLERHLRRGDLAARYGGEEFVAILPAADRVGALRLAERVRAAIAKERLVFEGARIAVTASLGVSVWPEDGKQPAALLAAADAALYTAKEGGRDRVVAAESPSPPRPAVSPSS